jgi:hypothetical protein
MHHLRLGFLSAHNYLDRNAWSGSVYYMQKALQEKNIEFVYLGQAKKDSLGQKIWSRVWQNNHRLKMGSSPYVRKWKRFASLAHRKLNQTSVDVILAPVAAAELNFWQLIFRLFIYRMQRLSCIKNIIL